MQKETIMIHKLDLLDQTLTALVANWKKGHDHAGYKQLLESFEHLESIVDLGFNRLDEESTTSITLLLPVLEQMELCIQNKDIIALTDVIEYRMCPFLSAWRKDDEISAGN